MAIIFTSDRINFATISEKFIPDYLVLVNDIEHVQQFITKDHKQYTEQDEREWLRQKLIENAVLYSMIEKDTDKYIGNIELLDMTDTHAYLGIAITKDMQNQNFGTEAIRRMLKFAFEDLGLSEVRLRVFPSNTRAIHVYEKCGFEQYDEGLTESITMKVEKDTL